MRSPRPSPPPTTPMRLPGLRGSRGVAGLPFLHRGARAAVRTGVRMALHARSACVGTRRAAVLTAIALGATGALLVAAGCQTYPYSPAKATRAYPAQLAQGSVVDIQVIPDVGNGTITVVNATAVTYRDFDLWINRRYMRRVEHLNAGESLVLDIESFWDERGEGPFPGGWFRYYQPTPIVLAQIQTGPDQPLIGLSATRPANVNR